MLRGPRGLPTRIPKPKHRNNVTCHVKGTVKEGKTEREEGERYIYIYIYIPISPGNLKLSVFTPVVVVVMVLLTGEICFIVSAALSYRKILQLIQVIFYTFFLSFDHFPPLEADGAVL